MANNMPLKIFIIIDKKTGKRYQRRNVGIHQALSCLHLTEDQVLWVERSHQHIGGLKQPPLDYTPDGKLIV